MQKLKKSIPFFLLLFSLFSCHKDADIIPLTPHQNQVSALIESTSRTSGSPDIGFTFSLPIDAANDCHSYTGGDLKTQVAITADFSKFVGNEINIYIEQCDWISNQWTNCTTIRIDRFWSSSSGSYYSSKGYDLPTPTETKHRYRVKLKWRDDDGTLTGTLNTKETEWKCVCVEVEPTEPRHEERMWFKTGDATSTPVVGDFDNDGFIDDIAYRGLCGQGEECWRVHLRDNEKFTVKNFGGNMWFKTNDATSTPVVGDFDNDGFIDDIAYRGLRGAGEECWRIHISDGDKFTVTSTKGNMWFKTNDATSTPVVGDFDNDGFIDDILYRGLRGNGEECWRGNFSDGSNLNVVSFKGNMWFKSGDATSTPVVGDFDNDGFVDDILYRGLRGNGEECWRGNFSDGSNLIVTSHKGNMWFKTNNATSTPVVGDFDKDGKVDDILYRGLRGAGEECWRGNFSDGSNLNVTSLTNGSIWMQGNNPTNRPLTGDFDQDGNFDDIVYRGLCGQGDECWRIHLN